MGRSREMWDEVYFGGWGVSGQRWDTTGKVFSHHTQRVMTVGAGGSRCTTGCVITLRLDPQDKAPPCAAAGVLTKGASQNHPGRFKQAFPGCSPSPPTPPPCPHPPPRPTPTLPARLIQEVGLGRLHYLQISLVTWMLSPVGHPCQRYLYAGTKAGLCARP